MSKEPEVRAGQVWEDKDKRMEGRRVVVVRSDPQGFTFYAAAGRRAPNFRSRTPRFRTAFRLVEERASTPETEGTVPVEFRAFGDGGELLASESVVSRADAPAMNVPVSEEG